MRKVTAVIINIEKRCPSCGRGWKHSEIAKPLSMEYDEKDTRVSCELKEEEVLPP